MTDSTPAVYGPPRYEPQDPDVRGMPTTARGSRGRLEAVNLLDLGALAAANGMTRARLTKLLDEFQEAALAAVLASASKLLMHNREVTQAQISAIGVRISRLRRVALTPQPTGLRGFLGMPQSQLLENAPEYVSLAEVRSILDEAIAALVTTTED